MVSSLIAHHPVLAFLYRQTYFMLVKQPCHLFVYTEEQISMLEKMSSFQWYEEHEVSSDLTNMRPLNEELWDQDSDSDGYEHEGPDSVACLRRGYSSKLGVSDLEDEAPQPGHNGTHPDHATSPRSNGGGLVGRRKSLSETSLPRDESEMTQDINSQLSERLATRDFLRRLASAMEIQHNKHFEKLNFAQQTSEMKAEMRIMRAKTANKRKDLQAMGTHLKVASKAAEKVGYIPLEGRVRFYIGKYQFGKKDYSGAYSSFKLAGEDMKDQFMESTGVGRWKEAIKEAMLQPSWKSGGENVEGDYDEYETF